MSLCMFKYKLHKYNISYCNHNINISLFVKKIQLNYYLFCIIMVNPYNNIDLKFPLTIKEIKNIDNMWEFINNFRLSELTRSKYRKSIISLIKSKYDIKTFYFYEIIVEKIYWNLITKLKKELSLKPEIYFKKEKIYDIQQVKNKILMRNKKIKESNVRKTYIVTKKNNLLYKYSYPNHLDLLASSIMQNRSVYESILSNKLFLFDIEIEPYNNNIEFDYPYPNLNTIKYFQINKKERLNNIFNLYYCDNAEKNWM